MFLGGLTFMCLCLSATHLLQEVACLEPMIDPEVRAHLEDKVISSMSLKDIEAMVENDERVVNAPKSKFIIIPKGKKLGDDGREALVIQRKPSSEKTDRRGEYGFAQLDFDRYEPDHLRYEPDHRRYEPDHRRYEPDQRSYQPAYGLDSEVHRRYEPAYDFEFGQRSDDDGFPSLFQVSDLESAHSTPVRQFYESIVQSVMGKQKFGMASDPLSVLDIAASETEPSYAPRFDYDAYSKDSTATKLEGKPYWKDAPERRDETVDENGCRTVVKKIVDPESGKPDAKSVVITKECEYPTLSGPDAKIAEAKPFRQQTSRYDDSTVSDFSSDDHSYEKTRPSELDTKQTEARDPIQPDYIDTMLEKHFKSFSNPLSSFRGFQDRFKLRLPDTFKNIKPTVDVQAYEFSNPKSGFDEKDSTDDSSYEHRRNYEYPQPQVKQDYSNDRPEEKSSEDGKEPKMLKKSFAYYRKDNPKSEPDDHQYAEEYAHGNYRSFSSSYDSEKDGPKKKE